MSYTKQQFQSGDVLKASQLNAMDDQIAANEQAIAEVGDFQPAMSDAAMIEAEKNPFAWNEFDKGYVSFVFDDLRDTIDSPCSIFEEYGFPIVLAAIPARRYSVATGLIEARGNYTPGMTMYEICQQVVADGGEIMAHNPRAITTELQWDKEFMYGYFVGCRKDLESWGLRIRGIIRAGGSDQLTFSPEIDRWLFSNYEYSNMSERFENHNIQRITINQPIEDLKEAIASAAENHTWLRIMAHDYEYGEGTTFTGEEDLEEILDYCKEVGISIVTYAYMYDRFGTSEIAKNRDTSLAQLTPTEVTDDEYYNAITGEHFTGSATGSWSKYPVVPGKRYYVTGSAPYSGAAYPCCAFFDGTDVYRLAAYGDSEYASITDFEVVAPVNADFMVLNTNNRYSNPVSAKVEVNLAGKVELIEGDLSTAREDITTLREDLDQLAIDRNTARVTLDHRAKVEGSLISCIDGSTAGTDRAGWEYRLYDVEPGKAYYVSGRAASAGAIYPCCAFLAEGSAYRLAAYGVEADTAYSAMRVVAPNNAATMLVNTSSTDIQPIAVKVELDLGEQVVYMNTSIESLQDDVGDLQDDVGDLQDDMGDAQTELTALKTAIKSKAPAIYPTASGSIAIFPDGADGMPLKSLAIALEPIQEGSGDPSPTNVRPISGHTGVTVTRTGKNMLNSGTPSVGYIRGSDGAYVTTDLWRCSEEYSPILPSTNYVLYKYDTGSSSVAGYAIYDSNKHCITDASSRYGSATSVQITTPANAAYIRASWNTSASTPVALMLVTETDSTFEPYIGTTYEITLPASAGTVYGGTLDPVKGELVITHAGVDLGSLSWSYSGSNTLFSATPDNMQLPATQSSRKTGIMSSIYPVSSTITLSNQMNDKSMLRDGGKIFIRDTSYNGDANAFDTGVTGQTLVYKLATPQTYTLTPTEIQTLLGYNAIWSDAGAVEVEYPADTKTYIDNRINSTRNLIAGIETGFTASKAYSVGDMLIIGDDLYKVASSIASGATITVGTNVNKTTVAEQLLALANA